MPSKVLISSRWLVALILAAACATKPKAAPRPAPSEPTRATIPKTEEIIIQDSTHGASSSVPSTVQTLPPETENAVRSVSVWIEGVGVDAFLGLGFLQEVEKHLKIESVHGTGFGCWIALSWASENRGSYAEWQASKWDSWDVLGANMLNRVMGRSTAEAFRARLENRLPLKSKDRFKIPESCPYVLKDKSDFKNPRELAEHEELWIQMRNTFFFPMADLEQDDRKSGFFRPAVRPDEFVQMTPPNVKPEDHLWIILTTEPVRREVRHAPQPEMQRGIIDGVRWIRKVLGPHDFETMAEAKDLKKKRSALLKGRKEGKAFFENPAVAEFIGFGSTL